MYFNEKRQGLAPFVNLRSDVGFKAVFADRNNKDILIGVLNQILPPEARIEDIKEYSDREQQQDVIYGKKTVLDLVCVDKDDRTFIVEMQASEEDSFFERCVYYASGLYHLELSEGDLYGKLHPVYVVSFLNYRLRHDDESLWDTDHLISYWQFTEKRTGMVANQTISVIFVEMTLFTKTLEECVTEFDRLFYIFKNSDGESALCKRAVSLAVFGDIRLWCELGKGGAGEPGAGHLLLFSAAASFDLLWAYRLCLLGEGTCA